MSGAWIEVGGRRLPLRSAPALVVGSGAAGLAAAVHLHRLGLTQVMVVTERRGGGASHNAGSDKQTYYKLGLSPGTPDDPLRMARDLAAGGCMHGDIALVEAAGSARAFFQLVELGVGFPHDRWGGWPGYLTDHDPAGRATSAGPRTSRQMVQAFDREVTRRGITVLDGHTFIALLTEGLGAARRVAGALALDRDRLGESDRGLVVLLSSHVVLATGGPGGMYEGSVYPADQLGGLGPALEAGAGAQNLTESQFGLGSVSFRWNVSGSYQQVIPRYISTDRGGGGEREFLNDAFPDPAALAGAVFRKGYQWPFDARRVRDHGSSLIDLLVWREREELGRRVFLDYRRDPQGDERLGAFRLEVLDEEARAYLERSGATGATPLERLLVLNEPAVTLYRENGIDLAREPLEIAVCAQHCNGGLIGDRWWRSDLPGLYPVGEINGSHGVRRPGGASLNAGQVGALRAATWIAARGEGARPEEDPPVGAGDQIAAWLGRLERLLAAGSEDHRAARGELQRRMSRAGAHLRDPRLVAPALEAAWAQFRRLESGLHAASPAELPEALHTRDLCLTHAVYLEALAAYLEAGGRSRGSFLVRAADSPGPAGGVPWPFEENPPDAFVDRHILELHYEDAGRVRKEWVPVRPIPEEKAWFETLWKAFRDDEVIR
jgi:succinate dehydrogenase/fumarate reductase flavoprotein subunit